MTAPPLAIVFAFVGDLAWKYFVEAPRQAAHQKTVLAFPSLT